MYIKIYMLKKVKLQNKKKDILLNYQLISQLILTSH